MMVSAARARKAAALALAVGASMFSNRVRAQDASRAQTPPTNTYWVYVGAESADLIHRIRFGPGGTVLEKSFMAGELAADIEGPHGLQVSSDKKYLYVSTGHGNPDGKFWKYEIDELYVLDGQHYRLPAVQPN